MKIQAEEEHGGVRFSSKYVNKFGGKDLTRSEFLESDLDNSKKE